MDLRLCRGGRSAQASSQKRGVYKESNKVADDDGKIGKKRIGCVCAEKDYVPSLWRLTSKGFPRLRCLGKVVWMICFSAGFCKMF